ncbi:pentatricopeptide repeat-containing protein, mitochondrial [Cinnamomum micranthum f. kanehirae]|uniref:Pentatricopeptide repeat-containing protein, mitochondrial n=1 Tax=Cinnamomum micranthum f. kanehirae TaxID=337451 RepID=A0A443Q164_9MAGN|nr:pentatricopeptide repeat-containing protein, mitochondrial [Cinnamomum micranthum f. kanehirae]
MWRSPAKAFIFRSSIPKTKTQVPLKTLARISSSSPHHSTWAPQMTQTIPFYPHPRFSSHSPEPIDSATERETHFPAIDKDCILDETPSSISLETESTSTILGDGIGEGGVFDKNPDPVLQALDDSSMVFDDGVEREDDFGQNPDFISQESVDSSEKDDTFGEDPIHIAEEVVDGIDGGLVEEEMVTEVHEVDMEQVERVLSVLQSSLEGPLESALDELVLNVSEEFVVRVIQTPQVSGENLIGFFRWASQKPEILITARVIDCLVRTISVGCRKREVYSLWDLVKEIGEKEKGLVNNEILNGLILLFWKLGKGKAGLEVFNKFDEFGCEHDSDSYYFTIEALLTRSMFDGAWSVCEKMLNSGRLPSNEEVGKILVGLCKGSKARDAYLVYLMAKEHKKCPPKSSVNFLVNKLSVDNETVHLAAELLEDFSGDLRKYAIKPFTSVIRGLCRKQEVNEAKKLVLKMINEGPPPGNAAFNFVMSGLSKAGEMNEAISLMKVMESRGLRPDVYTYTVIMSGFANGGQMDDACKIFSEAKKVHSKLCPAIYHTLIRGFCKIEEFDKALKFLGEMKESGVEPNADEYNKIIQSLCLKSLDWLAAEKLLEEMKESGLYLNGITRGLIRAVKELETEELQLGGISVVV